tara:strand:+ start:5592 stop:7499 length:1908 start_codon:yes stop_codon:yes gene_type:complete
MKEFEAREEQGRSCDAAGAARRSGSPGSEFDGIVDRVMDRRSFLGKGVAVGASAFVIGGTGLIPARALAADGRLGFKAVAANSEDTVTVPEGYQWQVVAKWGDPLWSGVAEFDPQTRGTGHSQERAFGDNNDGMAFFTSGGRNILVVNNEYTNLPIIYGNRRSGRPENADDLRKGKAAHGVSVMEIAQQQGRWSVVRDSPFNRRITADSPMDLTGPARGHDLMKTAADPAGTTSRGTWNNCANGRTPWGTYLTCEENFNGYFSSSDARFIPTAAMNRYGVGVTDRGYGWAGGDERFDIAKHPNECNRVGYVVEIDPRDPMSTPKKRTGLGRFKHENAEVVVAANGQVVVYMGDDERGEFLYRFISDGRYDPAGDNRDLLAQGKLFAAKFHDNLRGEWLELSPQTTGMASQGEVCIHARLAASKVGATTLDRPEWISVNPKKAEAYCCLTNNKSRGRKPNKGGDPMPVGGPNPRENNNYGQIVRWAPDGGDHTGNAFDWSLFVVAGNPTVYQDERAGSDNISAQNMFNSPDGLAFDNYGLLWIQTDGSDSNTGDFAGQGNNQMLVGDPETGKIKRFLVGPRGCEMTGITWSADRRTLFVGVQHPGEKGDSHFPDGGGSVPRSAVIAITRKDGGLMG